jgi:glucuronate isomerase
MAETLESALFAEICKIPLLDPHSHIDPHAPVAKSLDDILGYHYYTELAHSAGMDRGPLAHDFPPRERARAILQRLCHFDNTVQYGWFVEIARTFFGFQGHRVTDADCDELWESSHRWLNRTDWELLVLQKTNLEKIFLTNDFDDPLEGFDTKRYVPCLRTDDLVFRLNDPDVRRRLAERTGVVVSDTASLRRAVGWLFEHFKRKGGKACAISLPPDFAPRPTPGKTSLSTIEWSLEDQWTVFWTLAEHCRDFGLPFDLMIGVNRKVYASGVYQGQDLFDQRTSLIQYRELLNAFPTVTFCISVLTSSQNQELASYSWLFPNVVTSGHWWYANVPTYIERDLRGRLEAVPKTKQIGYYSDAYKLEFALPKYNMYRRCLARVLGEELVRGRGWSETQAIELARLLLRGNVSRIFGV